MATEHNTITDPNIHEPKGVSTATSGQVYVANGAGSGVWTDNPASDIGTATVDQVLVADGAGGGSWCNIYNFGVEDYNDLATATTPIALTAAGTWYDMTNDGAGAFTNLTYKIPGRSNIWNTTTNQFEFNTAGLVLGDTVDIRFDFTVTTSASNDTIAFGMDLGHGDAGEYRLVFIERNFKAAGSYNVVFFTSVYMGDTVTLNNPAKVVVMSDTTGDTVKVNGWYVRTLLRNPVCA